jgi:triosephosphate isomerase (TIM)
MSARRRLVVGNWKMFGTSPALDEIAAIAAARVPEGVDVAICPPFTLIDRAATTARGSRLAIGAQDVHANAQGAHTGCISVAMLRDAGATMIITGHSERRADNGETDDIVRAKAEAALAGGLVTIVCVGETEAERDAGGTLDIITTQLQGSLPQTTADPALVVAYEPVWAIGTGRTPSPADVAEVHAHIRAALIARLGDAGAAVRILYGGSVKPDNAAVLMALPNVDGALVGGASLTAASFLAIASA